MQTRKTTEMKETELKEGTVIELQADSVGNLPDGVDSDEISCHSEEEKIESEMHRSQSTGKETKSSIQETDNLEQREIIIIKGLVLIFGISSLLPWNVVINAAGYFMKKLKDNSLETTFATYLQVSAVSGNLIGSFAMLFLNRFSNPRSLAFVSNIFFILPLVVMTALAKVDSDSWKTEFFIINIATYSVSAFSYGVLTSSVSMLCSMIRPDVLKAFYIGKGLAGIVGSFLTIGTLAFPQIDVVAAAFYYFLITSVLILFGTTPLFLYFLNMKLVKTRTILIRKQNSESEANNEATLTMLNLLKKIKVPCLSAVILTVVSLLVFPATLTTLKSVNETGTPWTDKFFLPVAVFLVWGVADLAGKVLSEFVSWPRKEHILWFALARIILIPLILMTNIQPRSLPVWFKSDAVPSVLAFLTSFTGGHLFNLCVTYAPQYVEGKKNRGKASMVTFFFTALGLALGSACIFVVPPILNA